MRWGRETAMKIKYVLIQEMEKTTLNWLYFVAPETNGSRGNLTIDVLHKSCFGDYDTLACVRNSILALLAFLTFVQCLVRVIRLHWLHHSQVHQYLVFYLASAETCLLGVKWLVGSHLPSVEFSAIYLKLMQFILLCYFHWTLAMRILHREKLVAWVILPTLAGFAIYFTVITILGLIDPKSTWVECMDVHWLMLSVAELLAVQLFLLAGISITQKINTVSALESFKWAQKRDLWSVITIYELSALTSVSYDLFMKFAGDKEGGCSGIYHHTQAIYSPVLMLVVMVKYLLPIWIMLLVFQPTRGRASSDEERLLNLPTDVNTRTMYSGVASSTRQQHIYKQLLQPGSEGEGGSPPVVPVFTGNRISHFTPAFMDSVLRHTILTPIVEEDSGASVSSYQGQSLHIVSQDSTDDGNSSPPVIL